LAKEKADLFSRNQYVLETTLFLFLPIIDWVTKQSMEGKGIGIHWISGGSLEELEYADDLSLQCLCCKFLSYLYPRHKSCRGISEIVQSIWLEEPLTQLIIN